MLFTGFCFGFTLLAEGKNTKPFLVTSKPLEKTNSETMAYFVNASLKSLYSSGLVDSKVLLLYTDAARYMHKPASFRFCTQVLRVMCLAHGLHHICEEVRKASNDVNGLIAAEKLFLKAPCHICTFNKQFSEVPLPLESCWGLRAVEYYHRHFVSMKAVVHGFAANESAAGRKAQTALGEEALEGSLAYLCACFTFLAYKIHTKRFMSPVLLFYVCVCWFKNHFARLEAAPPAKQPGLLNLLCSLSFPFPVQAKFVPMTGDCYIVSCARDGLVRLAELSSTGVCKTTRRLAQHRATAHKVKARCRMCHT